MKLLIYIILALILSVVIINTESIQHDYIFFTIGDWTVQASLILFVFILVIILIILYFAVRALVSVIELPARLARWRKIRQTILSEKSITRGLYALIEGNWKHAEKLLIKGAPFSTIPMINYLGAAKAAQYQGALSRRDNYLKLAYGDSSQLNAAVGLTQAELQIGQHQTEQALATLTHLHDELPGNIQVRLMLLQTYQQLEEWKAALDILSKLEREKSLATDEIKSRKLTIYAGLLSKCAATSDQDALDRQWKQIPVILRNNEFLIEVYVKEMLKFTDTSECEILLRKSLKKNWSQPLICLYGLVRGKNETNQLLFAENLLKYHPKDYLLLLTLGRLCLRNNLWGKAQGYLEESLEVNATPDACQELAGLLEARGEFSDAINYYQKGLALATKKSGPGSTHYNQPGYKYVLTNEGKPGLV